MACHTCNFSPCKCGHGLTSLDQIDPDKTLARALVPCVDQIRDIYTVLGLRAYTVSLITTRWSGGQRGVGVEQVVRERELLPTPLIGDLSGISTQQLAVGVEEIGTIDVSQLSGTLTEDDLNGVTFGGVPIPADENFYWEIVFADSHTVRRRFYPAGVANYTPDRFEWTISLVKIVENRDRDGAVQG